MGQSRRELSEELRTNEMIESPPETSKNAWRKTFSFYVRECLAIAIWFLIFIKVFVYDVDLLIVDKVPWLQRLYPYKFFLLIGFMALVWITLGTKRTWKTIGYIAAYPLILLLWRIPKQIFKNWALLIVFLPAIESVILTVKWRFILGSLTMLAALGICLSRKPGIVIGCMAVLLLYLSYHYILRLRVAFRPTSVFADIGPTVEGMWRSSISTYKGNEFKARSAPDAKPSDYPKKHIQNIKDLYLSNLFWAHVAKKLDQAVSTRRTDVYFIVALIYSFVLTVTVFGFQYLALFKLDPSSFNNAEQASFWSFLLFSFNAILHTGFATVVPASGPALLWANLELVAGLIIGLCLVFILLTSSRERYRQDVKGVADKLSASAKQIERFLEKKLRMRLIDAEAKLIAEDPSFSQMLLNFGRTPPKLVEPLNNSVDQSAE
jgi:hypothetical protein